MFGDDVFEFVEDRFRFCVKRSARLERLYTRLPLGRGPGLLRRGPLPGVERHPERPDAALGRADRRPSACSARPSGYANGNTVDRQGRLVSCEHGARRVTRTEHDGSITVIADRYEGKRLQQPQRRRRASRTARSGSPIPPYGIDSDYEGYRAESEIGACHVYRVEPDGRDCRIVADDFVRPNGLAFSPDERRLYISDTGASHVDDGPRHIRVFDVGDDGTPVRRRRVRRLHRRRVRRLPRRHGRRIWTSAGDGGASATSPTAR